MDTAENTPTPKPVRIKAENVKVTVLMPAAAADVEAGTPARGVYLATFAHNDVPFGSVVIGEAAPPSVDGNVALIDPATGVLAWVPAADVDQYPDHAHAVAGVHIPA